MIRQLRRWLPDRVLVVVADSNLCRRGAAGRRRQPASAGDRRHPSAARRGAARPGAARARQGPGGDHASKASASRRWPPACSIPPRSGRGCRFPWYGGGTAAVDVATGHRLLVSRRGSHSSPLRWVLLRDPAGQFEPQALLSTDPTVPPSQIIAWFVSRWPVEVTFHELRAHLGVETQRQWSRPRHPAHDPGPVRALLPRDPLRPRAPRRPAPAGPTGRLVRESRPDLLGYPRLRPPAALAGHRFLHVTVIRRRRRNPARSRRPPHRYSGLRRLTPQPIWTKPS